jgi:phage terminase large subunit GpA-like protein
MTPPVDLRTIRHALRPDPILDPATWADAHRVLTTAETATPGQWRTERTPYLREPMQRLAAHDPTPRVVLMFPSQVGKTEVALNWLGYTIGASPCPFMMLQPTVGDAETVSKQRIKHLVETASLRGLVADPRARDSGNTTLAKEFPGGILYMVGSNSPAGLAGKPMGRLHADEPDRYPPSAGSEGDPLELARKRLSSWGARSKELVTSTPTVKDASRIEAEYNASSRGVWEMPCPHCGTYHALTWACLHWTGEPAEPETFDAWCECPACGGRIVETDKAAMLPAGRWKHERPERLATCWGGTMTALSAPVGGVQWRVLVGEWLAATARAKVGDTAALRTFVNTRLAETWEDRGEQVDASTVQSRVERIDVQALPERVRMVTAGVDVQDDRLEVEVVAWAAGMESWSLGYFVIPTDPLDAETWKALTAIRRQAYRTQTGQVLRVAACAIDTGYRTQAVYDYARTYARERVFAIKGNDQRSKTIWEAKVRKGGKAKDKGRFHLVAVNDAKDAVARYFKITAAGPGYCHVPDDRDASWFEQLTAEHRTKIRKDGRDVWVWRKRAEHLRNEALDCRVYALAACHAMLTAGVSLGAVQSAEPAAVVVPQVQPIAVPTPTLDTPPPTRHDVGARRVSRQGLDGTSDW